LLKRPAAFANIERRDTVITESFDSHVSSIDEHELTKTTTKGFSMTTLEANHRLARDLKLLVRDAEELLKASAGEAGERIEEARGRLSSALESAKDTCHQIQEKTRQAVRATDVAIHEHPYRSMGLALGVGLIVGALLARR
jgi:ElaB/YqjD/DUF883 family membrane-anchored ribosome-binding protein